MEKIVVRRSPRLEMTMSQAKDEQKVLLTIRRRNVASLGRLVVPGRLILEAPYKKQNFDQPSNISAYQRLFTVIDNHLRDGWKIYAQGPGYYRMTVCISPHKETYWLNLWRNGTIRALYIHDFCDELEKLSNPVNHPILATKPSPLPVAQPPAPRPLSDLARSFQQQPEARPASDERTAPSRTSREV